MEGESFTASVQYNDWKGTSAADRADQGDAAEWLSTKQLKQDDELLVGITLYMLPSLGGHPDSVSVEFLLAAEGNNDEGTDDANARPLPVRIVGAEMSLVEFFGLFKRFGIHISNNGMLEGREYTVLDH